MGDQELEDPALQLPGLLPVGPLEAGGQGAGKEQVPLCEHEAREPIQDSSGEGGDACLVSQLVELLVGGYVQSGDVQLSWTIQVGQEGAEDVLRDVLDMEDCVPVILLLAETSRLYIFI